MSIKAEASVNLMFYSVPEMIWNFWQPKYLKAVDMSEKVCNTHCPLQAQHFVLTWGRKAGFFFPKKISDFLKHTRKKAT